MTSTRAGMLLCVLDHPTQYDPPLWRAMSQCGSARPLVWYGLPTPPADREIDRQVRWSNDHGYEHRHVPGSSIARALLTLAPRPAAILVSGWRRPATAQVLPLARALGIPVIVGTDKTLNEPTPGGARGLGHTLFHALKARLFHGFFTTGMLGAHYLVSLGCPLTRIITGLYPIDIEYWQSRKGALRERAREIRGGSRFVVLSVSKLSDRESPTALLEAFARFKRSLPGAHLVHVGDGPRRRDFERRIADLELEREVSCPGYVSYTELAAYYGAADVFVHVPQREPWGISVLEAMACGLPVIAATSVGSAADLVVHGETGALANADDPASILAALELVAHLGAADLGSRALRAVHAFDVKNVAASLDRFVHSLAAESPPRSSVGSVLRADVRRMFGRWSL